MNCGARVKIMLTLLSAFISCYPSQALNVTFEQRYAQLDKL